MKTLISFMMLVVFSMPSCRFKNTSIQGQVLTYGTQKRIEHPPVDVMLVEKDYHSSSLLSGGYSYNIVEEQTMSANGEFSFRKELDNRKEYFLAVKRETIKPGYNYYKPSDQLYTQDEDYNQIEKIGGSRKVNLYLRARGWAKFNISRNSIVPFANYSIDLSGEEYINFDSDNKAVIISPKAGGFTHKYYYRIYNSDTTFSNFDELYVLPLDTVVVDVIFN